MDNFYINITSGGLNNLKLALQIAFSRYNTATGYSINESNDMLIFYWTDFKGVTKFPFKANADYCADFAYKWLEESANYYTEPDHDGDNGKGFNVFVNEWSMVNGIWQSIVAIQPAWAMYGK